MYFMAVNQMIMYIRINFVFLIISTVFQTNVHSNNDSKIKSTTIEAIVQKLCNITLNSLSNKPPDEKMSILTNIEGKLKRSPIGAGNDGSKYVKFIMHGIKLIAFNGSKQLYSKTDYADNITYIKNNDWTTESVADEINAKKQAIKNIAAKIENLAKKYLTDAKTRESKEAVIDKIKKKIMDAANRRHMEIHSKHKDIKSYGNIIAKGIDLIMKNNVEKDNRRMNFNDDDENNNKGVRLKILHAAIPTTPANDLKIKFTEVDCEEILDRVCTSTKTLNTFSCRHDKSVLPLEKLCNNVPDCLDKSDERDCAEQAIDVIQKAGRIMYQIESAITRKCLPSNMNKEILSEQNQVLRTVLQSQLHFLEKYANPPISQLISPSKTEFNRQLIKKTVHAVALVVTSLANAFDGSLCARRLKFDYVEEAARRLMGDIEADADFDEIPKPDPEDMRLCVCRGISCVNDTCSDLCDRICWQKFTLDKWQCRAVDGYPVVSLDLICDGKLDCYDESDEASCALGGFTKFEASNIYNNILKELLIKTKTHEYHFVLPDLLMLYDSIKLMQQYSTQKEVDILNLRMVREQSFTSMVLIYDALINHNDVEKLNNGYAFLSTLSDNLMNAMKRSRTGNDRIISSDKCLCSGSRCIMMLCSKKCSRACSVEPELTTYHCGSDKKNKNISINAICNGKPNCPNGEDEENCSKEVCRTHHLVVLRHKLKDIGLHEKGTALGEVLTAWKTKVTATIQIAEKENRPTPKVIKDIVSNILQDLVMAYASLEVSRRNNNNNTAKEFVRISQLVLETIKTCGQ